MRFIALFFLVTIFSCKEPLPVQQPVGTPLPKFEYSYIPVASDWVCTGAYSTLYSIGSVAITYRSPDPGKPSASVRLVNKVFHDLSRASRGTLSFGLLPQSVPTGSTFIVQAGGATVGSGVIVSGLNPVMELPQFALKDSVQFNFTFAFARTLNAPSYTCALTLTDIQLDAWE